jgi:CHAT domain-containing protein
MRRFSSRSVFLLALTLTAGCQSAMSVEEAKKVTASIAAQPFVPPPRTIHDIVAMLDQQPPADAAALKATLARLEQPPPATTDSQKLSAFYFSRGIWADYLGRGRQAIEDLGRAAEYARQARSGRETSALLALAVAEYRGGRFSESVTHLKQAISRVPKNNPGALITPHAWLATSEAKIGDLKAADATLGEMKRVLAESARWQGVSPAHRAIWSRFAAHGEGAVAEARGELAKAERHYRDALAHARRGVALGYRMYDDPDLPGYEVFVESARTFWIDVLVDEGRLLEAENEGRSSLRETVRNLGRYSWHTAFRLSSLVRILAEQGRYVEAETLARVMGEILDKIGASIESIYGARAWDALGEILAAQGRWDEALRVYDSLRDGMKGDPETYERLFAGSVTRALALIHGGRSREALDALEARLARLRQALGDDHPTTAELLGALALAHTTLGDQTRALEEFGRAIPALLMTRREETDAVALRGASAQRRRLILSAYVDLLARIRGTPLELQAKLDATAEAFRVADAVRMGAVQHALDLSAARAAARTPALAALARPEQDASQQIGALQGLLANALSEAPDQQNAQAVESLRHQIATLSRARQALRQEIEGKFPAYAELVNPTPATLAQVRAALRPSEALIATLTTAERTFVWAVPVSGPVAFAAVPLGERALGAAASSLRKAFEPSVRVVGDIPPFDVAGAYELYRSLLEPVKAGWAGSSSLLVVAHGPLSQLPPALLPTAPMVLGPEREPLFSNYRAIPWLIRTHAVTTLPSVTSLMILRALPPGDPSRRPFVGFGNPYFSEEQARRASAEPSGTAAVPALGTRGVRLTIRSSPKTLEMASSQLATLPPLPETADEIRSMALSMRADLTRDVFLGERANEQTVRTLDLSGYRVIAFATHGLSPGDLDGLTQPALALSAPEVTKVEGNGLLTMDKILALRLNAEWVVLSACNTASGQGAGAETISGLGRAFFYAGARALLVSNWPVETTSAKALTTDLFHRQAADPNLTRAQALQQTLNALIDSGEYVDSQSKQAVFSYAHPIFWAPFTLVGDGGQ